MPLSPSTLKSIVGDLLAHATEFVEVTESLPRRHMDRDRSMTFEVTQAEVPGLDDGELSQLVGFFVATNPAPDLTALETLASRLGDHGDLQLAIDGVICAMRALGNHLDAYIAGSCAGFSMREFSLALGGLCSRARTALEQADQTLKPAVGQQQLPIGCQIINGRAHVPLAYFAKRDGRKEDSIARRFKRDNVCIEKRDGGRYVAVDDLARRWLDPHLSRLRSTEECASTTADERSRIRESGQPL